MTGTTPPLPTVEHRSPVAFSPNAIAGLLDTMEGSIVVTDREGQIVLINERGKKLLSDDAPKEAKFDFFHHVLNIEARQVFREIEGGKHTVKLEVQRNGTKWLASLRWMPEPDWIVAQFEAVPDRQNGNDAATQATVQELLQEREITYRNLLAAYLKLQEVNRQKTVF